MKQNQQELIAPLIAWYRSIKQSYPWREEPTPYHVWLSEIMLQQTRIEAALPYYRRFVEALPTIRDVAACPDEKLMKLWEGLGYYSRVRNLKKAAGILMERYGGAVPRTKEELLALPGIGAYTAGAIASIAFGQPAAAVDGNVLRVLARLYADDRNVLDPSVRTQVTAALEAVYPTGREAGELTEGLMELGEQVCLPSGRPLCENCPLAFMCRAKEQGLTGALPVRIARTKRTRQELTVLVLVCRGEYALCKRPETGLLAGLWELPHIPGLLTAEQVQSRFNGQVTELGPARHIFSHITWQMIGYRVELETKPDGYVWETAETVASSYAVPTAFKAYTKAIV